MDHLSQTPTRLRWHGVFHPDRERVVQGGVLRSQQGRCGSRGYWDYPTKHDSPNVPDGIDFAGDTAFDAVFSDGYDQGQPNNVDNAGVLSAYGTMGQGGNVWEWNETAIGSSRGLRGGDWYDYVRLLAGLRTATATTRDREFDAIGFRVASVPEPGSITLMLCGAIAGLLWWNRKRT